MNEHTKLTGARVNPFRKIVADPNMGLLGLDDSGRVWLFVPDELHFRESGWLRLPNFEVIITQVEDVDE